MGFTHKLLYVIISIALCPMSDLDTIVSRINDLTEFNNSIVPRILVLVEVRFMRSMETEILNMKSTIQRLFSDLQDINKHARKSQTVKVQSIDSQTTFEQPAVQMNACQSCGKYLAACKSQNEQLSELVMSLKKEVDFLKIRLEQERKERVSCNEDIFSMPTLKYKHISGDSRARFGELLFDNGPTVQTPVYMPVGTSGSIKGLTSEQIDGENCDQIDLFLCNTYHLGHRPGTTVLNEFKSQMNFMNLSSRKHAMLTDSGGFQIVSLSKLLSLTEEGVEFSYPHDPSIKLMLTPEKSMEIQTAINSDIIMALDDVLPSTTVDLNRIHEATERTTRWLDRCINSLNIDTQNLFAIVQGGLDYVNRSKSLNDLISRKADLAGYAIGGLSGGEAKADFFKTVLFCCERLPRDKPRYLMGVGYPLDILLCASAGVDMFDCVFPTRTARFGVALTKHGALKLNKVKITSIKRKRSSTESRIEEDCTCYTCVNYSRQFLSNALSDSSSVTARRLITIHNIHYMFNLLKNIRRGIENKNLSDFVKSFLLNYYPNLRDIPPWVRGAYCQLFTDTDWIYNIGPITDEKYSDLPEEVVVV